MKKLMIAVAALAAFASGAAPAQASEAYIVTITARGLDLTTQAGADAFRLRAKEAARQICGDLVSPNELIAHMRCRAPFLRAAERRIARAAPDATVLASR